jgi:hypothetical protein
MPYQSDFPEGALDVKRLVAALLLLTLAGSFAIAQETQTLKERLSDKASDEQRVNNCRVPAERRGAAPRPDCPEEPRPPIPPVEAAAPAALRAR